MKRGKHTTDIDIDFIDFELTDDQITRILGRPADGQPTERFPDDGYNGLIHDSWTYTLPERFQS